MAGLCVLLETMTQQKQQHASPRTAQIISKATLLNTTSTTTTKNGRSSSSSRAPMAMPAAEATTTSSFLQRCFLCHRELADDKDIYIYRGDRAFCTEECRCRHIMMEEDGAMNCAKDAAAPRGRSRRRQAVGGGFAY